jgi:hypothetical protein
MNRAILVLALIPALLLTGCEELEGLRLPFGDKTSPYYWGEVFLDHFEEERVVGDLEPGPGAIEEPRVVLLVTGVTIPAEWFDPIVARLERDGFRPVVYEPPALLSGSLFDATDDLAEVVDRVRAESGQDKIDILAECTAGVVARHYIQSGGADKVSRLVTFVSPHHGIDKAPLAAAFAGWPALYDLTPGSEFLREVTEVPLPEGVLVTSIYTCSDLYIQPWRGSIVPGARNIGLCDGTVGHFQTFYDPAIYEIMYGALTEPIEGEVPAEDDELADIVIIDGDEDVVDGEDDGEVVDGGDRQDQEQGFEDDPSEDAELGADWDFDPETPSGEDGQSGGWTSDGEGLRPGGCATPGQAVPVAPLWGVVAGLVGFAVLRRR